MRRSGFHDIAEGFVLEVCCDTDVGEEKALRGDAPGGGYSGTAREGLPIWRYQRGRVWGECDAIVVIELV